MKPLTTQQLSSRALAMKQAFQTIQKTVAMCEDRGIFSEIRVAELQASAVIVNRAVSDLWSAWRPEIENRKSKI